jgi:heat shock protein HtpX
MVAVLVALGALGLLAWAPYLSELLALSLARADRDGGPETIRLQPILERLCAMADVPVPRLAVMPTDVPNAFSAGRNARNAIIIVTRGLVDRLDEKEFEAVLAHELAHIANGDAIVMTISAAPALQGRKLLWGFVSLPATSPSIPGKIGFAMLLLYLLPVVLVAWMTYAFATLLVMSISRYREFVADRGAALLTGAPEQLMSALQKIADQVPPIPNEDLRRASAMKAFFVLPTRNASHGFEVDPLRMFPTHPPLARRLERLEELASELGRARNIPSTPDPVFVESPTARPDNPQALGAFFPAVFAWGILGGAFLSEPDVTNGALVWIPLLGSLAFFGGIVLGLQGVGRASAGARGWATPSQALSSCSARGRSPSWRWSPSGFWRCSAPARSPASRSRRSGPVGACPSSRRRPTSTPCRSRARPGRPRGARSRSASCRRRAGAPRRR